ncbi:MAG: PHP domain-containing protein [Eubacteriales bacterium]|nr:PHP domain-containing protein [Eubacteriales bacterium]
MFVDLHVHSVYSDGCLTPRQLVQDALRAQVSFLALADHNTTDGCMEMRRECLEAGLRTIDAVEIDSAFAGDDLHILSYGADASCPAFAGLVRYAREMLDKMSTDLVQRLKEDGKPVSLREYDAFTEQKGQGGWKALFYIREACGLQSIYDVMPLYDAYGVTYVQAGFPTAEEVIRTIHAAGGLAVLAHPGIPAGQSRRMQPEEMAAQLEELFALGLDGAECHYPKHSERETELFLQACTRHGKLVTSGSDCHGVFSGKPVGYMKKKREDLSIEELWHRGLIKK